MTNPTPSITRSTFERHDHGTQVSETLWPLTGMRSLSATFPDGLCRASFITHDNATRRQVTITAHHLASIALEDDEEFNATTLRLRAEDGTAVTVTLFGITLDAVLEAVAKTVAQKQTITEDTPT